LDPAQLAHEFAQGNERMGPAETIQALLAVGFDAKLHEGPALLARILSDAHLPALAFTRDGRLMLIGQGGGKTLTAQIAGAAQPQPMDAQTFEALWSGQWIAAERTSPIAAQNQPEINRFGIGWFWTSLKQYKALMAEILLASFVLQLFALLTPLIFQVVIDKVLTHRTLSTLDVLVVALLGVGIFEVVLSAMRHYLFSHTTNRIDVELGARLFQHLLRLPMAYFASRRSGDTVARMRELDNARSFLTGQALTSWLDLFFAAVFLAVMFYYSLPLTLMVVAALPVFFLASWLLTPLLRKKLEDKFSLGAENQAFLVETVTSMETLKQLAAEPKWRREWERRLADHAKAGFESGHLGAFTNQFVSLASKVLTVLLLYFGAKFVIDGDMTVGGLIAFNMLAGRVNAPVLKLASLWQEFAQMKVSIKRLGDIMDAPSEGEFRPERAALPAIQGRITLEHVDFRYDAASPDVLSDVSFDVKPGELIGLAGVSGAGKTTLLRLITRLYSPTKGRVLIDGMDVNLMDPAWLRRQIGVVGQDTVLFNRTVRENIAFGNATADMQQVMDSAALAGAHGFILQLPEGYDTVIGERGSKLSGGQRARIAIARALITNPRLLLLDEATASLDYESERVIHDNLAQICAGRTVFIVAHRLTTLRLAERILVLEAGRLTQSGSHRDLVQTSGRYAALFRAHNVLEAA
ncbi:MAG TPA: type I secretion system permease/ATPase, partial [Burkholderiaceae bacterium]|nr:type I secretion system permease/ATPase [Burkholderiaceae bacterium]